MNRVQDSAAFLSHPAILQTSKRDYVIHVGPQDWDVQCSTLSLLRVGGVHSYNLPFLWVPLPGTHTGPVPITFLSFLPNCMSVCLSFFLSFFFCFLGPHPWHMKVPRLGLNWSYSCQPIQQPQQRRIQAASVTYTTAHSNARSPIHWARPGIKPMPQQWQHWILNQLSHQGIPPLLFFFFNLLNFFLAVPTHSMWNFLGQGLNLRHSSNLSLYNDSARFLTHWATAENSSTAFQRLFWEFTL